MRKIKREEGVDINKLLKQYFKKWYIFAISGILCIGSAYIIITSSEKVYEVYSILKMKEGSTKSELILNATNLDNKDINIEDKIIEIKSTNIIKKTINRLDFAISYFTKGDLIERERYKLEFPINVKIDSSINILTDIPIQVTILNSKEFELSYTIENPIDVTLYNYNEDITIKRQYSQEKISRKYSFDIPIKDPDHGLGFTVSLIGDPKKFGKDKLFFIANNPNTLTARYLNKLELEVASRNSNILFMRVGSNIIQKETAFLNTLMEVVIEKNKDEKNQEALKTIDFIDYQLEDASTSLTKAESDLESIGYATTSIGESSVLYEQRNQLETQIAAYNVRLKNLRTYLNNLENIEGSASSSGSLDIDDPMIEKLLIELTELYQQRASLKRTATEANPIIQRVNLEIKTTKEALRNALDGAINNLSAVSENLKNRLQQVNSTINRLPSAERQKLGIQRKFEFSDNTYDLFMQRKAAAGIALATNESDWSIIEYAKSEDELISPKSRFIYLLAIFLSLLIPGVAIVVISQLDTRIKSKEDIQEYVSIPILGSIVKGGKTKKLLTQYNSRSALSESFRDIRVNMQFLSPDVKNKIIGITSSSSKDGKSFVALNLSIVLAQSGKRVLLLDSDLRNSSIVEYIDLKNIKSGLSTYLIGSSSLNDCILSSGIANLDIIPSGPIPPNPSDLLLLPKTEHLLKELSKLYDYVLVDSPPVGLVGDYLINSKFFDINLYVVRYGYTRKNSFEKINNIHDNNILKNLNIIFNATPVEEVYGANPYYISDKKVREKVKQIAKKQA